MTSETNLYNNLAELVGGKISFIAINAVSSYFPSTFSALFFFFERYVDSNSV